MACAKPNTSIDFRAFLVPQLQQYLKDRGVVYSAYRKEELVKLCEQAEHLDLVMDPNFFKDDIAAEIRFKLSQNGGQIIDPKLLTGSSDLSDLPPICDLDLYQYLVQRKGSKSHSQMRDYKNLDGYQMYAAGYVESLLLCLDSGVDDYNVVKFKCKPKQRSEDPVNKVPFYLGWLILDAVNKSIVDGYCACKGGADGSCRHIVVSIYELIE